MVWIQPHAPRTTQLLVSCITWRSLQQVQRPDTQLETACFLEVCWIKSLLRCCFSWSNQCRAVVTSGRVRQRLLIGFQNRDFLLCFMHFVSVQKVNVHALNQWPPRCEGRYLGYLILTPLPKRIDSSLFSYSNHIWLRLLHIPLHIDFQSK